MHRRSGTIHKIAHGGYGGVDRSQWISKQADSYSNSHKRTAHFFIVTGTEEQEVEKPASSNDENIIGSEERLLCS